MALLTKTMFLSCAYPRSPRRFSSSLTSWSPGPLPRMPTRQTLPDQSALEQPGHAITVLPRRPMNSRRCWADYIITMSGIDLRQAQVPMAMPTSQVRQLGEALPT